MDRENTILLNGATASHDIDYEAASKALRCLPGRVVVEMLPAKDKVGSIFLPATVAANNRPDVGVVVAHGDDVPLSVGDVVVVRGYDGTWREGFSVGGYQAKSEIRCYGVFATEVSKGAPTIVDWSDSILARLDSDMKIKPLGANLLIRRDPIVNKSSTILLPDDATYRTNIGTVVAAGRDCKLEPGTRVVYHPYGALDFDDINGDPDLAIMSENAIEVVLDEAV